MTLFDFLSQLSASTFGLILVVAVIVVVIAVRLYLFAEARLKKKYFNNTPKDRRNNESGVIAVGMPNPGNNGGFQREIGAMANNIETIAASLKDHHDKSLSVQYDIKRGIEKMNEDEDGRHDRIRKSIDEQTGFVAANTIEVRTLSTKVDGIKATIDEIGQ